jgi:hypothetical protein
VTRSVWTTKARSDTKDTKREDREGRGAELFVFFAPIASVVLCPADANAFRQGLC